MKRIVTCRKRFLPAALFVLVSITARAEIPIRVFAAPYEPAPGTNGLLLGNLNAYPAIDRFGNVSFTGTLRNPDTLNEGGAAIWSGRSGALSLITQGGGNQFTYQMDIEQGGPLAYTSGFSAWVVSGGGNSQLIATAGLTAPGTGGETFNGGPPTVAVDGAGRYAFWGMLSPSASVNDSNHYGIWSNEGSGLHLVARMGEAVRGMAGFTWKTGFSYPTVVPEGVVFFGVLNDNRMGLFLGNGSSTIPLMFGGSELVQQAHTNSRGDLVWSTGSAWLKDSSGLYFIAGGGSPIFGGGSISSVYRSPHVDDTGRVIFLARNSGGGDGIYYGTQSRITRIASSGDSAPGLPGMRYLDIFSPQVNGLGQVAFMANLQNAAGDVFYDYLFASDSNGNVGLVAHRGMQTSKGRILNVNLYSRDFTDVERTQFADTGELIFSVSGPDISGTVLMIANVPEPAGAGLVLAGFVACLLRRRGRLQAADSIQIYLE